jgi:REP element-mobilizing transposase RayT
MPHTYSEITVHVAFSTKDRRHSISPEFQPQMWAYAAGICRSLAILPHSVGGTDNHIHLLLQLPPSLPLAKAVLTIKSNSSRWTGEQGKHFAWQQGYGAFGVSHSVIPAVVRYIQNQEIHHRKIDFETEFIGFLKDHGIEFDAKFVFD